MHAVQIFRPESMSLCYQDVNSVSSTGCNITGTTNSSSFQFVFRNQ